MMIPDSIIAAQWCLPVWCNGKLTKRVLDLPVVVYTDNQKGGMIGLMCELNIRVV